MRIAFACLVGAAFGWLAVASSEPIPVDAPSPAPRFIQGDCAPLVSHRFGPQPDWVAEGIAALDGSWHPPLPWKERPWPDPSLLTPGSVARWATEAAHAVDATTHAVRCTERSCIIFFAYAWKRPSEAIARFQGEAFGPAMVSAGGSSGGWVDTEAMIVARHPMTSEELKAERRARFDESTGDWTTIHSLRALVRQLPGLSEI